ncbi:GNAT family N-acetyltransferase [Pimelobacter simplex]|uniref:GNAT family N-acetyltransferase n=1 Tax=Nocardioides simplex TaxID=2045 RepID=UPI00214F9059|nr:GNAT family N-acetyltransferase [Pimelobacter simplex]UUW89108.1 GNAT family N-acetyltransferase [Pimelobacter simplex]UUW98612.1 GNAT family N-acetyltransferase [Pimelobacter simplex]
MTTLTLRPAAAADEPFLLALYAAGRATELDQVAWPPGQREAFVAMQHDLRERQYRAAYPDAEHSVVEVADHPAGRLLVNRGEREIGIVDIALLPTHQGQGIGGTLLRRLLDDAAATGDGVPVSLQVERASRARALYERLGFVVVAKDDVRLSLTWRPS